MTGFEHLERQLLETVGQLAPAPAQPANRGRGALARLRRLRSRSHPLLVLAGFVVSGSAAAAVFSLSASPSQPLAGRLPQAAGVASARRAEYSITVIPGLSAGGAGWGTSVTYRNARGVAIASGGGGGAYPTASNPVFAGDTDDFEVVGMGHRLVSVRRGRTAGATVGYVLTTAEVAAVRVGDRTIRTFTSREIPAGDRAAVFFLPPGAPILVTGWKPGDPTRSHFTVPGIPGSMPAIRIPTLAVLPLDRFGHVIPTRPTFPYGSFYSFWQAPSAITPGNNSPPYHGPTHPGPGVCQLGQRGLPALRPEWGDTIGTISPVRDSLGELFLSCVDTTYYLHGWPLVGAILLDARAPGHVLGPLPGAIPVAGDPNTVDLEGGSLTARRTGNAWLVVQGGTGLTMRRQALAAITIAKLDVHHLSNSYGPY